MKITIYTDFRANPFIKDIEENISQLCDEVKKDLMHYMLHGDLDWNEHVYQFVFNKKRETIGVVNYRPHLDARTDGKGEIIGPAKE